MSKPREWVLQGIIIGNRQYRDNDKSITLFSEAIGKVSFVARGVRKLTSKNRSSTDLFVFGDYYLSRGKAYPILTQGMVLESNLFIRKDLEHMSVAMAMAAFLKTVLPEEQPNTSLFQLFKWSLERLKTSEDPLFLLRYFLVKAIYYLGFSPDLLACTHCGNKEGPFYFQFSEGGLHCTNCNNEGFMIEKPLVECYHALEVDDFITLKKLSLEKSQLEKFDFFLEKWIEYIIDGPFNGFMFLKKLRF